LSFSRGEGGSPSSQREEGIHPVTAIFSPGRGEGTPSFIVLSREEKERGKGAGQGFLVGMGERLSRAGWGIDRGRLSPYNETRNPDRKGGGGRRGKRARVGPKLWAFWNLLEFKS